VELFVNGISSSEPKKAEKVMGTNPTVVDRYFPEGGWVTAPVSGGIFGRPMMDSILFAETFRPLVWASGITRK